MEKKHIKAQINPKLNVKLATRYLVAINYEKLCFQGKKNTHLQQTTGNICNAVCSNPCEGIPETGTVVILDKCYKNNRPSDWTKRHML